MTKIPLPVAIVTTLGGGSVVRRKDGKLFYLELGWTWAVRGKARKLGWPAKPIANLTTLMLVADRRSWCPVYADEIIEIVQWN